MAEEMGLSFVIVNFNMAGLVYKVMENVRHHVTGHYKCEFILGDNSTDSAFRLDDRFDGVADVNLTRLPLNEGLVKAVAALVTLAKYKYVVMIHPDVEFRDNCIPQLIAFMETHPKAGIVSPNLVYPDGTDNKIRLRFASPLTECKRVLNLMARGVIKRNIMQDEILWGRKGDAEADMTMSVCMVIRREALQRIGPLNTKLWTYYLNDWLGFKVRQAGYTCHYLCDAVAVHYERFADPTLYSKKGDSAYKTTGIPVEHSMQQDRFVFLRDAHSWAYVLVLKMIMLCEYQFLLFTCLPRYRSRQKDFSAYRKALWTIVNA